MKKPSLRVFIVTLLTLTAVFLIYGCGGGGGDGGGGTNTTGTTTPQITVQLPQSTLVFGQTITITASVANSTDKTVIFTATGGTISQTSPNSANYSAPNVAGNYTITATADANRAITKSVAVTVSANSISITPTSAILKPGQSIQFTASVKGLSNTAVTFTQFGGTITTLSSTAVRYTAGNTLGPFTITAKSVANNLLTAKANITISASGGTTATVKGTIKDSAGNNLSGVVVQFFDATGTQVSQTSAAAGVFTAVVPVTATGFNLLPSSLSSTSFYESFSYAAKRYDPLISTCVAPLPVLNANQVVNLPSQVAVDALNGPPPPPPDGCGA
jgi:hypothetical protein